MFKRFLFLGSLFALASCSYALDKHIQDVTIVTPGAEDTVCYMYVDDLRYKIFPPQTVNISKSHKDLVVDCLAPQNRRRKVVIEPHLSDHAPLNVANGLIPGTTWDIASNSLFTYPEVVTVDFTSAVPMAEALPAQNNPDIKQPEEYDLEEFTSNLPRLNSDRNATTAPLVRRQPKESSLSYTESEITPHTGSGKPADKGDLNNVIDGLTTSSPSSKAPPAAAPAPAAAQSPAPEKQGVGAIEPYPIESKKPAPAGPVMTAPDTVGPPVPLIPPH